ncbi:NUDIX domain-containing protein [Actinomadura alba]|uniref:NUDIX domain-containing protein n=1 Tax=Actinomadura alba TaxID=406431 RepID=UPI0028AA825C|nr:NUDIX domain-containing protein [Actinomadura alba]
METAITDDLIRAAGAVLWREGDAGAEVALIHRPKYDDWTFPKGKLDKGEHVLRAAVREVAEETGITPRLGRPLPPQFYEVAGRPKQVDYWAATARDDRTGTYPGGGRGFVPGDEVDRIEWLAPAEAEGRLSHQRDVELLRTFAAGPFRTTAVIVLRHASAGERHDWRDLDALRPLDPRGRADARELAHLLSAYEPVRSISSATARCVDTLIPYALLDRTSVTTDLAFTIDQTDLGRARARIAEIVAEPVRAVVCTHGEIAPALFAEICAAYGGRTAGETPERTAEEIGADAGEPTRLRKGDFQVLHLTVGETGTATGLAAVELHGPHGPGADT